MLTGWRDFDDTFRAFDHLQRRLDRAFWIPGVVSALGEAPATEARGRLPRRAQPGWPAINAFETKDAFVVKAEVPGLAESDLAVSVEDGVLVVRGERKSHLPEGYAVHLRERAPVAFSRTVSLPARVDADRVTATLKDGLLTITLPKAKEALPRQIAVKTA
jgi:HSP20 family protein